MKTLAFLSAASVLALASPAAAQSMDHSQHQSAPVSAPDNPAAGYFAGFGFLRSGEAERAREIWAGLVENAPEDAPWRPVIADRLARLDALLVQSAAQNPVAPGAGVAP